MEDDPHMNELIQLLINRYNAWREVNACAREQTHPSISAAAAVAARSPIFRVCAHERNQARSC